MDSGNSAGGGDGGGGASSNSSDFVSSSRMPATACFDYERIDSDFDFWSSPIGSKTVQVCFEFPIAWARLNDTMFPGCLRTRRTERLLGGVRLAIVSSLLMCALIQNLQGLS